jgi:hypothetical protein
MADKSISQLISASTPLAGSEELAIVQSGSTVKATAQDIADLAAGIPYKSYVAIVNQSGTNNPTVSVLENTIGTMTVTRNAVGVYYFASSGFGGFAGNNKVVVLITNGQSTTGLYQGQYVPPIGTVTVTSLNTSNSATDGLLSNATIEIRLYP